MNVGELKELLEGLDDDAEVRIAQQPSWPFEYSISDACEVHELEGEDAGKTIVYLAEGEQLGYLPSFVSQMLGWK